MVWYAMVHTYRSVPFGITSSDVCLFTCAQTPGAYLGFGNAPSREVCRAVCPGIAWGP